LDHRVIASASPDNRRPTRMSPVDGHATNVVNPAWRFDGVGRDDSRSSASAGVGSRWAIQNSIVGVFLVTLAAAVAVRYSGLFISVIDWDESLYALMAERWLDGALPYDAVWDQHSVGLPALFALVLSLFPKSILALRLSACIAVAIAATSLVVATRMIDRRPIVSIVVAALYIGWTARLWGLAANTEIYLNALIAPAMVLLMRDIVAEDRQGSLVRVGAGALLFGVALQIKHVVAAETALFLVAVATLCLRRRTPWRIGAVALGGLALPTALVIAYFHLNGLVEEYIRAVIDSNLVYAASRPSLGEILHEFPRSLFLPVAIAAAGIAAVAYRPDRLRWLLAAWAVAAGIDVVLPGQFWPHYFLLLAPAAALLAGVVVSRARIRWTGLSAAASIAVAVLLTNPIGIVNDAMKVRALAAADAPRMVAERIGSQLAAAEPIFVFNYQPVVYLLSDAGLPTRHVLPADWSARFRGVSGIDPRDELEAVFAKNPKFVVFVEPDWLSMGDDLFAALRGHLATDYDKAFEVEDRQLLPEPVPVQVYRRRDATPED
jgi:hypothetical protein